MSLDRLCTAALSLCVAACSASEPRATATPPAPPADPSSRAAAVAPAAASSGTGWLVARELPPPRLVRDAPGCLAKQGGCKAPQAALPRCPPGVTAEEATSAAGNAPAAVERAVVLAGELAAARPLCTLKFCKNTCCNACSGDVTLGAGDARIKIDGAVCSGDESLQCCPLAVGARVLARGSLARAPGGSLVLTGAELCERGE